MQAGWATARNCRASSTPGVSQLDTSLVLILKEPIDGLLQTFLHRGELEVRQKTAEPAVRRGLTMDPIALCRIELHFAVETHLRGK